MLEWIGKYYNFGRREGRDVSRWEMYQRTVGYAADGVGFLGFSSCFVVPVYAVGALWNPEAAIEMLPVTLAVYGAACALLVLVYWRYWLDLIQRSVETFEGEVVSEGKISGTMATSGLKNWRLTEKTEEPRPLRFFLCLRAMEKRCPGRPLLPNLCRGPVSFRYLRRSRCIVEIVRMPIPEEETGQRHGRRRRKTAKLESRF